MKNLKALCATVVCIYGIKILMRANSERRKEQMDWADLECYKNDDEQADKKYALKNRVVFMGDSVTELWLKEHPLIFYRNNNFINRGISGQTTSQMLLRFKQDVIDLKPKIVVILAGTNDIAGNTGFTTNNDILNNLVSMYQLAKANNIKIVIGSLLPAYNFPWRRHIKPVERILDLNNQLKKYAVKHRLEYADFFTPLADKRKGLPLSFSSDGVHPNKKAYAVMNRIILKAINKIITV